VSNLSTNSRNNNLKRFFFCISVECQRQTEQQKGSVPRPTDGPVDRHGTWVFRNPGHMNPFMRGGYMYGRPPVYQNGASASYGRVPVDVQVPRGRYGGLQHTPDVMFPPRAPYEADDIHFSYGGRGIPPMYGHDQGPPTAYESGWPAPSYRSGAGSPMRGNVGTMFGGGNNGHTRQMGEVSDLYDSGAVSDHDNGADHPPSQHSTAPDSVSFDNGDNCDGTCNDGDFACRRSCSCIPAMWRCDGDKDCVVGEDEVDCDMEDLDEDCNTNDGNVRCLRTGKCIRGEWLCDGDDDCGDFSDETQCGKYIRTAEKHF